MTVQIKVIDKKREFFPFPHGLQSPATKEFLKGSIGQVFDAELASEAYFRLPNGRHVHVWDVEVIH